MYQNRKNNLINYNFHSRPNNNPANIQNNFDRSCRAFLPINAYQNSRQTFPIIETATNNQQTKTMSKPKVSFPLWNIPEIFSQGLTKKVPETKIVPYQNTKFNPIYQLPRNHHHHHQNENDQNPNKEIDSFSTMKNHFS